MNIQWFPGHMAKTKRMIMENIKMVDIVIELLDARIPISSRNPDINEITANKPRIVVFNKSDLADPDKNRIWKQWSELNGIDAVNVNSLTGDGIKELKLKIMDVMKPKLEAASRVRIRRPVRTMVVGVPNVGKSAFINRISGRAVAVTGNRPGVTRNKQWVRINPEIQLMDTPGILWPKFDDELTGIHLAFTGAIKDEIVDVVALAQKLVEELSVLYPNQLKKRYKLDDIEGRSGASILEEAGKKRGCLAAGGEVDYFRISNTVLDEFRAAKIGRFTLELPEKGDDIG
ncbi:MAG TPA: ribosome biogenesis GTPase YlqF [Ruminiclostridium sp.]|nr:ribosome biogenesis GTPase YlqF [Clostridiaceae bacterium]HAA24640.1 ribosome biogenesis GTPase YlqF [Ruminiclostridium sp.]